MSWLNSLRQTLDSAPDEIVFFFRDDDAGWEDTRLFQLLDLFAAHETPIDVAVIPRSMWRHSATRLRALVENRPQHVSVHQHGYAHENHEQVGRKCEFGESRPAELQLADIRAGKDLLSDLLGPITEPIFTPPWNRCTERTAACLREAGFTSLSRDRTAMQVNTHGLAEIPISVDWCKRRNNSRVTLDEIGDSLNRAANSRAPVGVMLHHAVMDEEERGRLAEFLQLLSSRSQARCMLMREVVQATVRGETS